MDFYDHGDPDVDAWWRDHFRRRDEGLAPRDGHNVAWLGDNYRPMGLLTEEEAHYVPPELSEHGRMPESERICWDIWDAS